MLFKKNLIGRSKACQMSNHTDIPTLHTIKMFSHSEEVLPLCPPLISSLSIVTLAEKENEKNSKKSKILIKLKLIIQTFLKVWPNDANHPFYLLSLFIHVFLTVFLHYTLLFQNIKTGKDKICKYILCC